MTRLRGLFKDRPDVLDELDHSICPDQTPQGQGRGYVVDCLHSARQSLAAGSYPYVVRAAVALGHDTDTTACVAGGIAGIRDGLLAIPAHWREALRGQDLLKPLLDGLLAHCAEADPR